MKRWSCSYFLIVVHLPQYGRRLWRWVTRTLLALCFATITCPAPSPAEGNIGMNIFKYYLTIFSHYFSGCNDPSGEGGGWSGPSFMLQCCPVNVVSTDYWLPGTHQTEFRKTTHTKHRTRVHQIFAWCCIVRALRESSVQSHQSLLVRGKKCLSCVLTNWYVIPRLYQEFTQYIILPSSISCEKGCLGVQ